MTTTLQMDDEIDLRQVAKALSRQKLLIAKISFAAVFLTSIYAFTRQPIWEGQFNIVLSKQSAPSRSGELLQSNPNLAKLIGAGRVNNQLETEVEILESPSVLKPVFEFVKQKKRSQNINIEEWSYANWLKENLTIELIKGTSVLELSYRDTDKELVLPVIQRISKAYQDYSGRDRKRGIQQAVEYLDQQIEIYNEKSVKTLRAAQEYGMKHNLTSLKGDSDSDIDIKNTLKIEAIRIKASNEIRRINEQIKQLDQLQNDPETLMYIGRNMPKLATQKLPQTLDDLETRLALLRSNYTEEDDLIRRLLDKRERLIQVFKRQTYGYLYAQRKAAEARLKAAERPKGVLIKYRELLRAAGRDEGTLTKLESERQILALEQARKEDPWELISTPTLLGSPVAPRKKRMIALGLLAGLVGGGGASLFVERRKGLVYSEDELKSLLPCQLVKHLPATNQDTWSDATELLATGPLRKVSGNGAVALIPIGNMPNEQIQAFGTKLRLALQGRELLVSTDLLETSRCVTQLLVTSPGVATRPQLSQLRQKLALQGTPLAGWVLLDPDLNLV